MKITGNVKPHNAVSGDAKPRKQIAGSLQMPKKIHDSVIVDSELSDTSTNPVENRVIKAALDGIEQSAPGVFLCHLARTTSAEIEAAYQAGKVVLLRIPRFNAVAQLTGRDDAVTHHFGAVFSDSSAEDLVAVHVTCASDSWHVVAKTLLANRATISSNKFSPETTYSVGDYVLYRGFLYRFTAAHTGAWATGDVVSARLADDVAEIAAKLERLEEKVEELQNG